jgi:adenine-specific DNA methylase
MTQYTQLELFNSHPTAQALDNNSGTFLENMKLPMHRWFRYSAGFSAIWVNQVIREHQSQVILDPFAGSGTVCVVADQCGKTSFGVESHPFVYRIAQGKINWKINIKEFQ